MIVFTFISSMAFEMNFPSIDVSDINLYMLYYSFNFNRIYFKLLYLYSSSNLIITLSLPNL